MIDHPNKTAILEFLKAVPAIKGSIAQTENFGSSKVTNAYTTAWHDQATNSGFTIIAMNGPKNENRMKLVIELTGNAENAQSLADKVNKVFFSA